MDSNFYNQRRWGGVKSWLQPNMAEAWRIRRNSQLRESFGMSDKRLGRAKEGFTSVKQARVFSLVPKTHSFLYITFPTELWVSPNVSTKTAWSLSHQSRQKGVLINRVTPTSAAAEVLKAGVGLKLQPLSLERWRPKSENNVFFSQWWCMQSTYVSTWFFLQIFETHHVWTDRLVERSLMHQTVFLQPTRCILGACLGCIAIWGLCLYNSGVGS